MSLKEKFDYDPNSLDFEDALSFILKNIPIQNPNNAFDLKAPDSLNYILAKDVLSPINVPGFDNSAMDGYGFNTEGSQHETFKVIGKSFAGTPFNGEIAKNECIKIMTGAKIPPSCDCVIMQEKVEVLNDNLVKPKLNINKDLNIRKIGEDIQKGDIALIKGTQINPKNLGYLCSLGIPKVNVYRKLKVSFFSTGDELVELGNTLADGQIYDSNRYTIKSYLENLNCEIFDLGNIKDDKKYLKKIIVESSKKSDVIITSGGVSVGEADFIKQILNEVGETLFWKIAMKPGRPLAFGKINNSIFFGLPGNPVAVMITLEKIVSGAIRLMQGITENKLIKNFNVKCKSFLKKTPGRVDFQRGILKKDSNGELFVESTGAQGSNILSSMVKANCLIVLPKDSGNIEINDFVDVELI
jgi:molybdopterin molybdotransferase